MAFWCVAFGKPDSNECKTTSCKFSSSWGELFRCHSHVDLRGQISATMQPSSIRSGAFCLIGYRPKKGN